MLPILELYRNEDHALNITLSGGNQFEHLALILNISLEKQTDQTYGRETKAAWNVLKKIEKVSSSVLFLSN